MLPDLPGPTPRVRYVWRRRTLSSAPSRHRSAGVELADHLLDDRHRVPRPRRLAGEPCYIATRSRRRRIFRRTRGPAGIPAPPDSSPEFALRIAPAFSAKLTGPPFDSQRLHND